MIQDTTRGVVERLIKHHIIESNTRTPLNKALKEIFHRKEVIKFTELACDLSWKMVIQDPLMSLTTHGNLKAHNPDLQELLFTPPRAGQQQSRNHHGEAIVQYLEPALCQGDTILVKARVKTVVMHATFSTSF